MAGVTWFGEDGQRGVWQRILRQVVVVAPLDIQRYGLLSEAIITTPLGTRIIKGTPARKPHDLIANPACGLGKGSGADRPGRICSEVRLDALQSAHSVLPARTRPASQYLSQ